MIVMRFSPRDDAQQDTIMAKPVEVEVDSNFNNLRSFFDSMAKLPRIVSITDFKINQLDKQTAEKTLARPVPADCLLRRTREPDCEETGRTRPTRRSTRRRPARGSWQRSHRPPQTN